MNSNIESLIQKIKKELGLLLSISLGIFLFVLFFQPFIFESSDFNNRLIIIAGLGTIVFLLMILMRIVIPQLLSSGKSEDERIMLPSYLIGFAIFILNTVAFEFYLRYVGLVSITFFVTVKVVLISMAPPLILGLYDKLDILKGENELLIKEMKIKKKQIEGYEEDVNNKTIEFISENNTDNLNLVIGEIAFIRSADNYVEIVYKEGDSFKKKLIRNTLRNIEVQVKQYSCFLRCHRTCIVNASHIEKLVRGINNHFLKVRGFDEDIPVSRQYLLKIQEAL